MNTKISLAIVAAAATLGLAACGNDTGNGEAPAAAAPETPEQTFDRLAAELGNKDFLLRQLQCMDAISYAKRSGERRLGTELMSLVEADPGSDFFGLVRGARAAGATHEEISAKRSDQLRPADSPEAQTPEYVANLKECLTINKVGFSRSQAASGEAAK